MIMFFTALICTLIQFPSLFLRFVPFKRGVDKKKRQVLTLAYSISFVLNFLIWFTCAQLGFVNMTFYKYGIAIFSLIMTGVNIFIIKGRYEEHLFVSGIEFLLGQVLVIGVDFATQFFDTGTGLRHILIHSSIVSLVYAAVYPLFKKLLVSTISPFWDLETGDYWKSVWLIPFIIYFATTIAYPPDAPVTTVLQLVAQFLLVFATVLICRTVAADSMRMKEQISFSEQFGRQKEHYSALSERVMEMRRLRHDIKHHIDVMKYYIDSDNKDALLEYCKDLIEPYDNDITIPYSGNSAVDGLIYRYTELCQKNKIDFRVSGSLTDIKISDVDICVLLGNALDNAITACQFVDEGRYISLSVRKDGGSLAIMMQNSFDGVVVEDNKRILSRKRNNEQGIGLSSMKSVCHKYGGEMEVRYENKTFSVMFYNL